MYITYLIITVFITYYYHVHSDQCLSRYHVHVYHCHVIDQFTNTFVTLNKNEHLKDDLAQFRKNNSPPYTQLFREDWKLSSALHKIYFILKFDSACLVIC